METHDENGRSILRVEKAKTYPGYKASSFSVAYKTLCDMYLNEGRPLSKQEINRTFCVTRGLLFEPGTTLEDVLERMIKYKLLVKFIPYKSTEEQYVPLDEK